MEMKPVNSSNIAAVGYDAGQKVLAVQFKGGGMYHYKGVPQDLADKFVTAESMGRFLNQIIKPAFEYEKVA